MKIITVASSVFLGAALAGAAHASPLTSAADPAPAGATLVDFEAYQGGYTIQSGGVSCYGARVYIGSGSCPGCRSTRRLRWQSMTPSCSSRRTRG